MASKKHKTYIVCGMFYMVDSGVYDQYWVFKDYDDNLAAAKEKYEWLRSREETHSLSICELIESTDY